MDPQRYVDPRHSDQVSTLTGLFVILIFLNSLGVIGHVGIWLGWFQYGHGHWIQRLNLAPIPGWPWWMTYPCSVVSIGLMTVLVVAFQSRQVAWLTLFHGPLLSGLACLEYLRRRDVYGLTYAHCQDQVRSPAFWSYYRWWVWGVFVSALLPYGVWYGRFQWALYTGAFPGLF